MEANLIFVDKTKIIWNTLRVSGSLFLIANRRMGKTLTLNIIDAIFSKNEAWWQKHAS